MLTRLAVIVERRYETGKQTKAVLKGVLAKEVRRVDEEEIRAKRLDFQRWLETDAPYDVVIPFRPAILAAFNELWDEIRTVQLRIRRDNVKRAHHRDRDVRNIYTGRNAKKGRGEAGP